MSDEEYIEAVKKVLQEPRTAESVREAFRLNNMKFKKEHAHWCNGCRVRVFNNLKTLI